MTRRMTSMIGLSLMFVALNASAQMLQAGKTYSGTLQQAKGGVDWACTATVVSAQEVKVKWYNQKEVTYKGPSGPAGGKAGAPITMNAKGVEDESQVRFMFVGDGLQVEWWPTMAEKAGQKQNKPAHVKGTIRLQ